MTDFVDSTHGIVWNRDMARLRRYATASGGKATVLKIEIEVRDPFELSHMIRALEEALRDPDPKPARRRSPPQLPSSERLALPAPRLRLTHGGAE